MSEDEKTEDIAFDESEAKAEDADGEAGEEKPSVDGTDFSDEAAANGSDDPTTAGGEETLGEAVKRDITAIYDIPVKISAVLGTAEMNVSQLLKLGRGAVVDLDRRVGEAIDIYVNNRLVARGEVIVMEEKLGVTMTEIVKSDRN